MTDSRRPLLFVVPPPAPLHAGIASTSPVPPRPTPASMTLDVATDAARAVLPDVPLSDFSRAALMSLEVDLIAESLYQVNSLLLGDGPVLPFTALPALARSAYREAAIVAAQRIVPAANARALQLAETVVPGFSRGLSFYLHSLLQAPAVPPAAVPTAADAVTFSLDGPERPSSPEAR